MAESDGGGNRRGYWRSWLDEREALTWPAMGALAIAFVHYLGYVASSGQRRALGVSALTVPTISEGYIFAGLGILISATVTTIYFLVPVSIIGWGGVKLLHYLPGRVRSRLRTIASGRVFFGVVFAINLCISSFGLGFIARFIDHTEGVLLKPPSDVGRMWERVSFDTDKGWIFLYQMLFAGMIVSFILLSVWLLRNVKQRPVVMALYAAWASVITFSMVGGYAFFTGATNTTEKYPAVAFSGVEQLVGSTKSLVVLLDSDEKLYALLVVYPEDASNEKSHVKKVILYLPISQVKWMIVLKQMPLYDVVHYADIMNLSPPDWPKQ